MNFNRSIVQDVKALQTNYTPTLAECKERVSHSNIYMMYDRVTQIKTKDQQLINEMKKLES